MATSISSLVGNLEQNVSERTTQLTKTNEQLSREITERKQVEEELAKHRENLGEMVRGRTAELDKRISEVEQLNSAMVNVLADLRVSKENLELTTRQLSDANKELESFSYSVSHDLRAPLRAIDGFSQILVEDYGDKLDEGGQHQLDVIQGSARQMGQLIDDLLAFSRLGRKGMSMSEIDMGVLAQEVFEQLQLGKTERSGRLNVDTLPPADGDRAMIREVLVNFLSNAMKFTRPGKAPVIEVTGTVDENETVYSVKDKGVGFDMKYVDKVFQVFQRLHSAEEFEGTGIGLALVQRIIHRHGGRVWAEGEVNKGATFYFTLPGKSDK
jgi:light-regulated signal transduction histidine kinase (bacteriophytochrome)